MCSLMAAFAASSWAASSCPTEPGWSVNNAGICVFTISSVKDTTITIPKGLETFDLNYNGDNDGNTGKINIHCDNHLNTVSITPIVVNLNSKSTLSIRNRVDALGLGLGQMYVTTAESFQPETDMYTCAGKLCQSSDAVTGLNALSIVFESKKDEKANKFAITVRQKQYDFGPMQVLNVQGIDRTGMLALAAAMAGVDVSKIPAEAKNGLLLRGADENTLMSVPADIPVDYVYLDRTFTTNDNGDARFTIAFPFDISSDAIEGASEILQFTRVGKVDEDNYAVFMKKVYCAQPGEKCPAKNGMLEAYKPYIIQLEEGATSLEFDGDVKLKKTPSESGYADFKCQNNSNWVFRGVFKNIAWNDEAPDNVYGYAAEGDQEGQFVKAGKGAYILPFRGFLIYLSPLKIAPANSSYALRPNVLPDEMNIVIEGDNNETTVIGKFNTRTGEMRMNSMKHTYDLKGRRVNGTNNARGAYYGKKVLMK